MKCQSEILPETSQPSLKLREFHLFLKIEVYASNDAASARASMACLPVLYKDQLSMDGKGPESKTFRGHQSC